MMPRARQGRTGRAGPLLGIVGLEVVGHGYGSSRRATFAAWDTLFLFGGGLALAATFMPVLAAMAVATGLPTVDRVVPAAIAFSCGFLLPVGTAPNAIVCGSGLVPKREMMRAGLAVDILSAVVVVGVCSLALRWLG